MDNAVAMGTDTSYQANVTYTCLNGYFWEGLGDPSIDCEAEATWSIPQGRCERTYTHNCHKQLNVSI